MAFPVCTKHGATSPRKAHPIRDRGRWLAAEPFRLFFASGMLWSIAAVALWPLFYSGLLLQYPGFVHSRLMIQTFAGAFVVGFLGTAGPRMAEAPKLTVIELAVLFSLHSANGIFHLLHFPRVADTCFLTLLGALLCSLVSRIVFFRKDAPPPQMILALAGILSALAGTALGMQESGMDDPDRKRLAQLLLHQGFLLPPVLGVGAFIFPRIMGKNFGGAAHASEAKARGIRALLAATLLFSSFFLETSGWPRAGGWMRTLVTAYYLAAEVQWQMRPGEPIPGTLARGLVLALPTAVAGLALSACFPVWRVPLEHLLYIGGFGLLMMIVASRVLFGHSGEIDDFSKVSKSARGLLLLTLLAAATRASADFWPRIQISHHNYASLAWGLAALLWLYWHRRRFVKREPASSHEQTLATDS